MSWNVGLPPCLWTTLSDQVGEDHKKSNLSLSETFFHHLQNSFPPDWWCNMWATPHCTSPNPADQKCGKEAKEGRCSTPAVSPHCPRVVLLPPSRNDVSQQNSQQPIHTVLSFSLCSTLVDQKPLFGTKWPNRNAISTQRPGTRSSKMKCLGMYLRWAIERF